MGQKRTTLDEILESPPQLTHEQRSRLSALTDEEITRAAESDPDNPPLTDDELTRMAAVRVVRHARERTGLSQAQFAERFQINLSRLRDWEQGRFAPDSVALAYLRVITQDPETVTRALDAA